jgi:shikimate dehydrogenase
MRVFGLIGNPLDHSRSEQYFSDKFRTENISDCVYKNFPLEDLSEFPALIKNNQDICGLNVTSPFKTGILPFLDSIAPPAAEMKAVNCIRISKQDDKPFMIGYNTDKEAFKLSLMPLLRGIHPQALILGSGGASHAVACALKELGIEFKTVSRSRLPGMISYEDVTEPLIARCRLIINATPLGMFPSVTDSPSIPYEHLTSGHLLYDLVYNPEMTSFLNKGAKAGARIKNGLEMLHLQAELSWQTWK